MTELAPKDGLELALRGGRSGWRDRRAKAEAEQWARLLAPLAMAMPGVAPPAALAGKIDTAVDRAQSDLSQTIEERLEDGRWREIAPKVAVKPLWDERTFLVRCGPGGVWPAMPDRRFEHIVILQGDLMVGEQSYGPGDYYSLPAGTAQGVFSSRAGLMMLVRYR
jgi:ChrR Cupin-like domain